MGNLHTLRNASSSAHVADVVKDLRQQISRITGEYQEQGAEHGSVPSTVLSPVLNPTISPALGTGPVSVLQVSPEANVVAVPRWLGSHLHRGGLPRGGVTDVTDCPTALVELLAAATATGSCVAVVGYPRLSLAAVEADGGDLDRMVVVPEPMPHVGAVLGILVERLDLVLYRSPTPVTPTMARPVEARLRHSQCALVVCGGWPRAQLHLDWRVDGVTGLGRGSGRISGVTFSGRAYGRGQPPVVFREDAIINGQRPEALERAL